MDKRIFYTIAGVLVLALIILVVVLAVLNSRNQQQSGNLPPGGIAPTDQVPPLDTTGEQLPETTTSKMPTEAGPDAVAKIFYEWYITTPNPLGSGQYINNENISEDYKDAIKGFVNRGDHLDSDPILTCVDITPPKNIVALAPEYDPSRLQASVALQEDVSDTEPLYEVILSNINQKWLVEDVRCIM